VQNDWMKLLSPNVPLFVVPTFIVPKVTVRAGSARREIERRTGLPVISSLNASDKLTLDTSLENVGKIRKEDLDE